MLGVHLKNKTINGFIRLFERIHIDYAEFEGRMFFLVVDGFSKWPFVFDLGCEASTTKTVMCLLEVLAYLVFLTSSSVIMAHSLPHMNSGCSVSRMVFAIRRYHRIIPQLMARWNGWSRR